MITNALDKGRKMNKAEQILEFDKIKEKWAELALTKAAKEKIKNTEICLSEDELKVLLRHTTEAKKMMEKCGMPPIISFHGITEIIQTAEKECCLTAEQLEMIASSLTAIRRLKDYLNRCKMYDISLAYYEENLESCDEVREMIGQQIRNGKVDDHASSILLSIRKELITEDEKMHEKVNQIIRANKSYLADSFATMRNGHICIPVKKEYRFKISGSTLDKSSTGNTIFVEPASVAKHYENIQLLKIDEENEEMRIRYTLTAMVLEVFPEIHENIRTVEKLDFDFSKGKLSFEYDGIEPVINTERKICLKEARHPFLDKNSCVPLSFEIGDGIRGIIITGPNTGGKTVTIKTVALTCMMAQCGLHVPCIEADICMNSNFLCDIGDGQNLSENLSTFSAHLKNILQILAEVNKESLVILDELGSGTDPTEGMGIAIAVLEELKKSGALYLVTTHYPEIKQYAKDESLILNARMDFDKENLKPLYRLIIGESGESCAFAIAKRLGMSNEMLNRASEAAYGKPMFSKIVSDACRKSGGSKIQKHKDSKTSVQARMTQFNLGDSVMIYPDRKIGIVCQTTNEKGVLRVQMKDKKIWINHKRVKLHVPAAELYPEDYDFSIIFDTVEMRKLRHDMERKYVEEELHYDTE